MTWKPYLRKAQFYETDGMGVVYHGNYILWMEEARTDFLEQIGWSYVRADQAVLVFPDGKEELILAGETEKALQYEILDVEQAVASGDFSSACIGNTVQVVKVMDRLLRSEGF